jgi:hypothetical protein
MYSKYRIGNLIVHVGETKIKTIQNYIDAGYTSIKEISERFGISQHHAWMIYVLHVRPAKISKEIIGSKTESYYDKEEPVIGPYLIIDLKGAEKEIAEKDTSTKLWTWVK